MSGVLLIRKVILWFFIIMSPVFPLLVLYAPVRNTAKIWIGEFFRWVLYAPIFAILLSGLVSFWRSYIPLMFDFTSTMEIRYPTAVNILLGGPGQEVSRTNSINLPDTFIQYIIALFRQVHRQKSSDFPCFSNASQTDRHGKIFAFC